MSLLKVGESGGYLEWISQNKGEIASNLVILVALAAIMVGAAACATQSHLGKSDIGLDQGVDLFDVEFPPLYLGGLCLLVGLLWKGVLHKGRDIKPITESSPTTDDVKKEVLTKRLKIIGMLCGFIITMFGVGLIAASAEAINQDARLVGTHLNGLVATGVLLSIVGGGVFGGALFFTQLAQAWHKYFRKEQIENGDNL